MHLLSRPFPDICQWSLQEITVPTVIVNMNEAVEKQIEWENKLPNCIQLAFHFSWDVMGVVMSQENFNDLMNKPRKSFEKIYVKLNKQ